MKRPRGKPVTPETLLRQAEVVKLRRGGMTWDMIAQRLGYADPSGARNAYVAASQRIIAEDVGEIRNLEAERLDMAQAAIWGKVMNGDLQAVQTLIRLMERRSRLLGLDAPVQVTHMVSDSMQSEIEFLAKQLGVKDLDEPLVLEQVKTQ